MIRHGSGLEGMMAVVETREHIAALRHEGVLLAEAAGRAGLDAAVPSCPSWQVRDLLRHTGYVHRWAARYVAERLPGPPADEPGEGEVLAGGPPDAELIEWFRAGHAALLRTLEEADPAMTCWTVLPGPSCLASWARRQAHETAIHRLDVELADGAITPFAAGFAADGIDELIMGFLGRDGTGPTAGEAGTDEPVTGEANTGQADTGQADTGQADTGETDADEADADGTNADGGWALQVRAADGGQVSRAWLVKLTTDGRRAPSVRRGTGRADCEVSGPAGALYPLLWNRYSAQHADVTVTGDASVLRLWRDGMQVTWK